MKEGNKKDVVRNQTDDRGKKVKKTADKKNTSTRSQRRTASGGSKK
jgi:hypothetical protein